MKIKFVRQDFWIGLYWKTEIDVSDNSTKKTTWYVLSPCSLLFG